MQVLLLVGVLPTTDGGAEMIAHPNINDVLVLLDILRAHNHPVVLADEVVLPANRQAVIVQVEHAMPRRGQGCIGSTTADGHR